MNLYQKMKRNKAENKGFTLVELIVVLVILAILAAILVPALLGYIDEAKKKQIVLDGKSCLTAAQAELSSMYASDETSLSKSRAQNIIDIADANATGLVIGTKRSPATSSMTSAEKHEAYTICYVAYTCAKGTIYYNGTSWVDDAPATTDLWTVDVITTANPK